MLLPFSIPKGESPCVRRKNWLGRQALWQKLSEDSVPLSQKIVAEGWRLGYDLPKEAGFLAVIASVGAFGLPLSGSVKDQLVLRVEFAVVELTAAPVADEFRQ